MAHVTLSSGLWFGGRCHVYLPTSRAYLPLPLISMPVLSNKHLCHRFVRWEWHSVFLLFRHFLFKTSSGTTPLFSSSSPGYPLTSGTVYSPPPRLLPRNTFSRSAFKLKKPSKYCSWKCAAVTAIAAAALLAVLLSYFIGEWTHIKQEDKLEFSLIISFLLMRSTANIILEMWTGPSLKEHIVTTRSK